MQWRKNAVDCWDGDRYRLMFPSAIWCSSCESSMPTIFANENSDATSNARPLPEPMSTNANIFGFSGMDARISRISQAGVASYGGFSGLCPHPTLGRLHG